MFLIIRIMVWLSGKVNVSAVIGSVSALSVNLGTHIILSHKLFFFFKHGRRISTIKTHLNFFQWYIFGGSLHRFVQLLHVFQGIFLIPQSLSQNVFTNAQWHVNPIQNRSWFGNSASIWNFLIHSHARAHRRAKLRSFLYYFLSLP